MDVQDRLKILQHRQGFDFNTVFKHPKTYHCTDFEISAFSEKKSVTSITGK